MKNATFSIVIPLYNYRNSIRRAIESVLPQLTAEDELLVINDGSTDEGHTVVDELLHQHPNRFLYINQENRGLAAVRNRGINETTKDYLLFLDADDELAPDALSVLREFLSKTPVDYLVGGHISISPNGEKRIKDAPFISPDNVKNFENYLNGIIKLANGAVAIHRKVFDSIKYPEDLRQAEDLSVFAEMLARFNGRMVKESLLCLYKSPNSMRHDYAKTLITGLKPVEYLFGTGRLPEACQNMHKLFLATRLLSLSRSAFLAKDYSHCCIFYQDAIASNWKVVFRFSYLTKYLRAKLKSVVKTKSAGEVGKQ